MAQKLWDFGRRNGGTGRKNYGILHYGMDDVDATITDVVGTFNAALAVD